MNFVNFFLDFHYCFHRRLLKSTKYGISQMSISPFGFVCLFDFGESQSSFIHFQFWSLNKYEKFYCYYTDLHSKHVRCNCIISLCIHLDADTMLLNEQLNVWSSNSSKNKRSSSKMTLLMAKINGHSETITDTKTLWKWWSKS